MNFGQLLQQFANDDKVEWVLVLIAVDFVLGVAAAIVTKTFRLSYVGDFLRKDVVGKVLPWFVLYAAGKVTTEELPGGATFATLADGAFAIIVLALSGSILKSLAELGLFKDEGKKAASLAPTSSATARAFCGPDDLGR